MPMAPAWADKQWPIGESYLDPWNVTGSLFVAGGPGSAETYDVTPICRNLHEDRRAYNLARPWEWPVPPGADPGDTFIYNEWLPYMNSWTQHEIDSFVEFAGWNPDSYLGVCNTVHKSGWIPVDAAYITAAEDDLGIVTITINVTGPPSCDPGHILMGSATFWFDQNSNDWSYHYGTDWVEDLSPGNISVSGDLTTSCELITPSSGDDFAGIAEGVPQGQSNVNPTVDGLTGLDTWLWYDFAEREASELGPFTTSISAMGTTFTLTAHAWVDAVAWDPDCTTRCEYRGTLAGFDLSGYEHILDFADQPLAPASTYDGGAGTEADAAAIHVYETKGEFVLSTATIWTGYYTFQGVNYPYAPIVIANALPYTVREIRSVPTGG